MTRYEKTVADVSPGAHELASASGSESAESTLTRLMKDIVPWGQSPTDNREEPQDDRPQLLHYDLGTSTVFYQADEIDSDRTISATATVDVEAVR